jgi:hypothetical protein
MINDFIIISIFKMVYTKKIHMIWDQSTFSKEISFVDNEMTIKGYNRKSALSSTFFNEGIHEWEVT